MKRMYILMFLIFISFSFCKAQPKLEIEGGKSYDWGKVKPDQSPLTAKVKLFNTGTDSLRIFKVKPGCGCTTAPLDKKTIEPGGFATLDITLNIGNHEGPFSRNILIATSDPDNDEVNYILKCDIQVPLKFFPSKYLSFNAMEIGKESVTKVIVTNTTDNPIQLKEIRVDPTDMTLNIKDDDIIPAKGEIELIAKAKASTEGAYLGTIKFKTTDPDLPRVELTVRGYTDMSKKQGNGDNTK